MGRGQQYRRCAAHRGQLTGITELRTHWARIAHCVLATVKLSSDSAGIEAERRVQVRPSADGCDWLLFERSNGPLAGRRFFGARTLLRTGYSDHFTRIRTAAG